ncbi:hypothetical protein HYH02_001359 [Chlamydomonas schloesseri]|uniref:Uncharacterized protein n=1 Tax=Chlamydomonas schloesseri TaxID=2026947 RepID=A0A835WU73_9CHLO|nr:hypothetical protein HYH02_001359 [Chlamydomonas schloesseri]|eukprot:KAG2454333.1 hypothetical protein HYH02_001359 [Chlamydomonas schloesseri]
MWKVLAILLAFVVSPARVTGDCPDSYWDCLRESPDGLVPSGGGLVYGNCFSARSWKCRPCDDKDATNATYILDKCNTQVIECDGLCVGYADLPNCCNGATGRCGSLNSPEQMASACAGTTPLVKPIRGVALHTSTASWRRLSRAR